MEKIDKGYLIVKHEYITHVFSRRQAREYLKKLRQSQVDEIGKVKKK